MSDLTLAILLSHNVLGCIAETSPSSLTNISVMKPRNIKILAQLAKLLIELAELVYKHRI